MSVEDSLAEVVRKRAILDQQRKKRLEDSARSRLLKAAERKLTTTFVGSLSRFEERFGSLWGHGLPAEQLSQGERQWLEIWSECRDEVLDLGNQQVRALRAEFSQYEVRG